MKLILLLLLDLELLYVAFQTEFMFELANGCASNANMVVARISFISLLIHNRM